MCPRCWNPSRTRKWTCLTTVDGLTTRLALLAVAGGGQQVAGNPDAPEWLTLLGRSCVWEVSVQRGRHAGGAFARLARTVENVMEMVKAALHIEGLIGYSNR